MSPKQEMLQEISIIKIWINKMQFLGVIKAQ
jgi:hypothetical protein